MKKNNKKDIRKQYKDALGIQERKESGSEGKKDDSDSDLEIDRTVVADSEFGARTASQFKSDVKIAFLL